MLTVLKAIPWQGLCLVAVATMIFFGGWHAKSAQVQPTIIKLTDDLGRAHAVLQQQQDQLTWERNYELQLRAAADQAVAYRAELSRLRTAPHPRVVCDIEAPAGRGSVPGAAGNPGTDTPGGGVFPQAARQDIGNDLYILADDADDAIELAREFIAKLPPP